jgi:hypothetical protein
VKKSFEVWSLRSKDDTMSQKSLSSPITNKSQGYGTSVRGARIPFIKLGNCPITANFGLILHNLSWTNTSVYFATASVIKKKVL